MASALAGELGSYLTGLKEARKIFSLLKEAYETGKDIKLPPTDAQASPIFDKGIEKLGNLPPELVEDIPFIYDQVRTFRSVAKLLSDASDGPASKVGFTVAILATIDRASSRCEVVVPALREFARRDYSIKKAIRLQRQ